MLAITIHIRCTYGDFGRAITNTIIVYGHIRCQYRVLANLMYVVSYMLYVFSTKPVIASSCIQTGDGDFFVISNLSKPFTCTEREKAP